MLDQYSFSTILSLLTLTLLIAVVIATMQRVKPNLQRPIPGVPIATLPGKTPMESWCSTRELLSYAYQKYGEQPFQVISPLGATLIVRNQYAENMKSDKRLSLNEAARREMFEHIPGFEGATMLFKTYPVLPDALRTKLTPSLGLIMEDLVEETRLTLDDMFDRYADGNWKEMPDPLAESILHIVARVSSRIFLGAPLCRDDKWLVIAKTYTKHAFRGSRGLRAISPWLQRIKSNSMPDILACRKAQRDAENLIREEVARRDAAMRAALARGEKAPKRNNDAIAWLTETSQNIGRDLSVRDLCYLQMSLSVAAIHMTSELLTHAMLYTCQYPEIVEPLREEVVSVLETYGWNKQGMYQLRLMDSFLKEVQRCTRTLLSMFRVGREDVVVAGVKVPKGTKIWVEAPIDHEPIYGPDANNFDAWRFVKLASSREKEGKRNDCHFTTASKEHLNWGYGEQTCPGRFFAAQEIKIVLSHLLLHYDWSFNPGVEKPNNISFEVLQAIPDPIIKLRFRKRQPEFDMDLVN